MTQAAERIEAPERTLPRLSESLVIAFALAADATFTLIVDWPDKPAGSDRSFLALRFAAVRDFRREAGTLAELQQFHDTYAVGDGVRPIVVEHIRSTTGERRTFEAGFGLNFGGIAFSFRTLAATARHTRAEGRDGGWIYRDWQSGETLDYTKPFADMRFD